MNLQYLVAAFLAGVWAVIAVLLIAEHNSKKSRRNILDKKTWSYRMTKPRKLRIKDGRK